MSNPFQSGKNARGQRRGQNPQRASGGFKRFQGFNFNPPAIVSNLIRDVREKLKKWADHPLKSIGDITAFLSAITAAVKFLFSSGASNSQSYATNPFLSVFPARVMVFVIISASIGWTISTISIWLTSRPSPWSRLVAHFATVISSFFLAACIDWIFAPDLLKTPKLVLFCAIVGAALAVFLAKTNYKLTLEPDSKITMIRAELLTTFAASITFLVFLREFTGL